MSACGSPSFCFIITLCAAELYATHQLLLCQRLVYFKVHVLSECPVCPLQTYTHTRTDTQTHTQSFLIFSIFNFSPILLPLLPPFIFSSFLSFPEINSELLSKQFRGLWTSPNAADPYWSLFLFHHTLVIISPKFGCEFKIFISPFDKQAGCTAFPNADQMTCLKRNSALKKEMRCLGPEAKA